MLPRQDKDLDDEDGEMGQHLSENVIKIPFRGTCPHCAYIKDCPIMLPIGDNTPHPISCENCGHMIMLWGDTDTRTIVQPVNSKSAFANHPLISPRSRTAPRLPLRPTSYHPISSDSADIFNRESSLYRDPAIFHALGGPKDLN